MPEGDTVWLAASRMNTALAGATLTKGELRVPQLATVDLTGATVTEVVPRGKHMLTRFADGRTLRTHYRMDGSWHIYRKGTPWKGGPAHSIRAVLSTTEWDCVGYRLHDMTIVPTSAESELVGHLGPDVLGPDWNLEEALRRLRSHPGEQIGVAILDQRNLAGIGTLYRSELLFLQGLHPRTPVGRVANLRRVVQRGQQLLHANRWRTEQSTTGDLRPGRSRYVFERPGQPCRRCGTPVLTEEFGPRGQERRSYWCPRCQPQPQPG